MDDGSKPNQFGYLFCTQSFSDEDIAIIRDVLFNKFKLNTTKHKDNSIYIMSDSKLAFKKLIEPPFKCFHFLAFFHKKNLPMLPADLLGWFSSC